MDLLTSCLYVLGTGVRSRIHKQSVNHFQTLRNCREVQQQTLSRLMQLNGDSQFSQKHHLHTVNTPEQLARQFPVSNYEVFRPYIEETKLGNHQAFLGRKNELLMYSLSSGTTSDSKYIPITKPFLDDYRHGWQMWGINAMYAHPKTQRLHIVGFTSDHDRYRTPGGTPCGNISGLVTAMQKPIVQKLYSVPGILAKIKNPDVKQYASMRMAIADKYVGMVTTANPSTLIHLAKMANDHQEQLIRDIHDGTLSQELDVEREHRQRLKSIFSRKKPKRARELRRIVEQTGELYPKMYWPHMQFLGVWCGGSVGAYVPQLRELYGNLPVRDHGLHASEGRMTLPVNDNCSEGILEVTSHYFEFIPEDEHDSVNPIVLQAHELEQDKNYFILLTTASGLTRYDICDVVKCVGFHGTTPKLRFLHKGAHISNVTGEKISESQVVDSVHETLNSLNLRVGHFTVAPIWGDPPSYRILMEEQDIACPDLQSNLARQVDLKLKELNCEYKEKRETGRLQEMTCIPLPQGTWHKFAGKRQSTVGGSMEQYKHPCLSPKLDFISQLLEEYRKQELPDMPMPHFNANPQRQINPSAGEKKAG